MKRRDFKLFLMKENPHCFYCGILVKDYNKTWKKGEVIPLDIATIDHTKSRFERVRGEVVDKVLACFACNQHRSKIECTETHKDIHKARTLFKQSVIQ